MTRTVALFALALALAGCGTLPSGRGWGEDATWRPTLFSMALGNFMASFVNDAFLGLETDRASLTVAAVPDGAIVQWRTRWR